MQRFLNNWGTEITKELMADDTKVYVEGSYAKRIADVLGDNDHMLLTLDNGNIEIVKVIQVTGGALSVERGLEGTKAINWEKGSRIEARITAGTLMGLQFDVDYILTADGDILVANGDVLHARI